MKRTQQVFSRDQIDASFAADRRVDLGQHGRRDLDYIDAAHIDGGEESGYVADYAAAQSDQGYPAIGSLLDQFLRELLQRGKTFRAFAIGHFEDASFDSRRC